MTIESIIKKFPKTRPDLSKKIQKIYNQIYQENRSDIGTINKIKTYIESWEHKQVEKNSKKINSSKCLEIGAGNLNHFKYVNKKEIYDIVEPFKFLYEGNNNLEKINNIFSSISDINNEETYDRIFSINVLEHITNLPEVIIKSKKILKKNGIFQAAIPCEGEFAWWCSWKFGTGIPFWLKYKTNYEEMMRHEHVNSYDEITKLVNYYFGDIKIIRSPLPFFLKIKHTSFFAYIEAINQ